MDGGVNDDESTIIGSEVGLSVTGEGAGLVPLGDDLPCCVTGVADSEGTCSDGVGRPAASRETLNFDWAALVDRRGSLFASSRKPSAVKVSDGLAVDVESSLGKT